VGTVEVGTAGIGTAEVGTVEVGTVEVGSAEVGIAELRTAEVGTAEVGTDEVGTVKVGTAEVGNLLLRPSPLIPLADPVLSTPKQLERYIAIHGPPSLMRLSDQADNQDSIRGEIESP